MFDPPLTPTVRAATTADAELLLGLMAQYYQCDGIPFERAAVKRGLNELLTQPVFGGAPSGGAKGLLSTRHAGG